jgi:hypothetical protein
MNDNDGDDVISGTDADENAGHKVRSLCRPKVLTNSISLVAVEYTETPQWDISTL